MVRKLIGWSLNNPFVIDPPGHPRWRWWDCYALPQRQRSRPTPTRHGGHHPEVVRPGVPRRSAEEVERQVTVPLEVTFMPSMPGLTYYATQIRSSACLILRNQFEYGVDYDKAKQEVINPQLQFTHSRCRRASLLRSRPSLRPAKSTATLSSPPKTDTITISTP